MVKDQSMTDPITAHHLTRANDLMCRRLLETWLLTTLHDYDRFDANADLCLFAERKIDGLIGLLRSIKEAQR